MNYPSDKADSLELYVRKTIPLSAKAFHLYGALRWLERDRHGFCKPVFAGFRDVAKEAAIDLTSVKPGLMELQEKGLCVVKIGRPVKAERIATSIQRKTLEQIKAKRTAGDDVSSQLARVLSQRPFSYHGLTIKPMWTTGRTGRVMSSKPNIQGDPASERLTGLVAGLTPGLSLIHADIRQAEPTIIKVLLGIPVDRDLYAQYVAATGKTRDHAKRAINMLAYCKNAMLVFAHWPPEVQVQLRDYVERLHEYKVELYAASRRTRAVTTLAGRAIAADKGQRTHPGNVMNWRVQGTVADVVNEACLSLLDVASVIVPIHDAIYAAIPSNKAGMVETAIITKGREIGLALTVKSEVHHAC